MRERLAPFALVVIVVTGALLGLQARVNGELGRRIHSAIDAAFVSFAIGTVICTLLVVTVAGPGIRRLRRTGVRWWWLLGGFAGAAVVGSTAAGVPKVGVALVTVCIVTGTAVGAMAVDTLGLGPGGRLHITTARLAGAAMAVGAVAIGAIGGRHGSVRPALFALLFAAGAGSAWQQAANGQLRRVAASTRLASFVSFAGGTVALAILSFAFGHLGNRHWPNEWWLYTGGVLGAIYIGVAAALVGQVGVLRLLLATVGGQLVGAVILDATWPEPGAHLRASTIGAAVLTLVAVAVTSLRQRTPNVNP